MKLYSCVYMAKGFERKMNDDGRATSMTYPR